MAGISPVDLNSLPEPQTESSPVASPASSLRPIPRCVPPPPSLETSPASLFQPLITPLASPEMIAATSPPRGGFRPFSDAAYLPRFRRGGERRAPGHLPVPGFRPRRPRHSGNDGGEEQPLHPGIDGSHHRRPAAGRTFPRRNGPITISRSTCLPTPTRSACRNYRIRR